MDTQTHTHTHRQHTHTQGRTQTAHMPHLLREAVDGGNLFKVAVLLHHLVRMRCTVAMSAEIVLERIKERIAWCGDTGGRSMCVCVCVCLAGGRSCASPCLCVGVCDRWSGRAR